MASCLPCFAAFVLGSKTVDMENKHYDPIVNSRNTRAWNSNFFGLVEDLDTVTNTVGLGFSLSVMFGVHRYSLLKIEMSFHF